MGGGVSKNNFDDAKFEQQIRDYFHQDPAHCEQVLKKASQIVEKERKNNSSASSPRNRRPSFQKRPRTGDGRPRGAQKAAIDGDHLVQNMVHEEFDREVTDFYQIEGAEALGTGLTATVYKVQHKTTGVFYALKSLKYKKNTKNGIKDLRNETTIMAALDHPNIVRLIEAFYSETHVHLILELCSGGELFDHLEAQQRFTELDAKRIIKKILGAVRYLHDHNVVHRDLKLENVLFDTPGPDGELKVCDFGLSQHFVKGGEKMKAMLGTPYYIAPEVLKGKYDEKCDLWSLGVITFMLLSGTPPFGGNTNEQIMQAVQRGRYHFYEDMWAEVSQQARDFVASLLRLDSTQRPSAADALQHAWFKEGLQRKDSVLTTVIQNLVKFRDFSALKRLTLEMVAFTLQPHQIKALRGEFEKFDDDNSGEIDAEEFQNVLCKSGHLSETDVKGIFDRIDLDHTGNIHWHEFLAAALDISNIDDKHLQVAFDRLDQDGKGYIGRDDVLAVWGSDAAEGDVASIFKELDSDQISHDDFMKICKTGNIERRSSLNMGLRREALSPTARGGRSPSPMGRQNSQIAFFPDGQAAATMQAQAAAAAAAATQDSK